jgi:hypothetical protein
MSRLLIVGILLLEIYSALVLTYKSTCMSNFSYYCFQYTFIIRNWYGWDIPLCAAKILVFLLILYLHRVINLLTKVLLGIHSYLKREFLHKLGKSNQIKMGRGSKK